MIRDESYIHIWWWMLSRLKLKWSELLVYATIYSFTNGTDEHCYKWSASYLAERCWTDKRNVYRILKKLEEKWYIQRKERIENWVKFVDFVTPYDKMSGGGSDKMSPHNNSSFDNNSKSTEGAKSKPKNREQQEGNSIISVKDFSDITEIFKDEPEYVTFYKIQIKILLKMVEIWYVVSKDKDSVLDLFKRMKEKAEIFNIKAPDGSISWSLFLQRTDKRVEWNKWLNQTPRNHKLWLIQFLQSK